MFNLAKKIQNLIIFILVISLVQSPYVKADKFEDDKPTNVQNISVSINEDQLENPISMFDASKVQQSGLEPTPDTVGSDFDYENFDIDDYISTNIAKFDHLISPITGPSSDSLQQSGQIEIDGNDELISLNLPGSGIPSDPYLLQNLNITLTNESTAITIRNTNLSLVIANNLLVHKAGGISILVQSSTDVSISNNSIDEIGGNLLGITIGGSQNIKIQNNRLNSSNIQVLNSNDLGFKSNKMLDCPDFCFSLKDAENFILYNESYVGSARGIVEIRNGNTFLVAKSMLTHGPVSVLQVEDSEDFGIFENKLAVLPTPINTGIVSRNDPASRIMGITNGITFTILNNLLNMTDELQNSHEARNWVEIETSVNVLIGDNDFLINSPRVIAHPDFGVLRLGTSLQEENTGTEVIKLPAGTNFTIFDNRFIKTARHAIITLGLSNSTIVNNLIEDNQKSGIIIKSSSSLLIKENKISRSRENGITIRSHLVFTNKSKNIIISDNEIIGSGNKGVEAESSENVSIAGNTIKQGKDGIKVEKSDRILISQNQISDNDIGIQGSDVTDLYINGNEIIFNSDVGIIFADIVSSRIINNTIERNGRHGIEISQNESPEYLKISNNSIFDHSNPGSLGLQLIINSEFEENNIVISKNRFIDNFGHIKLHGNSVIITDNEFDGFNDDRAITFIALDVQIGSSKNVIAFNSFRGSLMSHLLIASTIDGNHPTNVSKNNLISWNNFHRNDLLQVYDSFSQNLVSYNYWDTTDLVDVDSDGIYDSPFPIDSSRQLELSQVDYFPLVREASRDNLTLLQHLSSPILISPVNGSTIDTNLTNEIFVKWLQMPSSDLLSFSNVTDFRFELSYSNTNSEIWIDLGSIDDGTELNWEFGNLQHGLYEIEILTLDLITGRNATTYFTLNIGPYTTPVSFFDNPTNVAVSILGLLGLTGLSVYGVTTYRHRRELIRQADKKGQAREYLDFVSNITEDD